MARAGPGNLRSLRDEPGNSGWLRTGDLGFLLDGELYVTGRIKDVMKIRGRSAYPQDVERAAERALPDLRPNSCASFPVATAAGEAVAVVIEPSRGESDSRAFDAAADHVRMSVARDLEMTPHSITFVRPGTFPRTSSGNLNGVGLVYFANYIAFLDMAERAHLLQALPERGRAERITRRGLVERDIAYFANARADDTIEIDVEAQELAPTPGDPAEGALVRFDYRARRRSDGRLVCVSSAVKVVPREAECKPNYRQ